MKAEALKKYFQDVAGNRVVQHILFWGLSFGILVNLFSSSNRLEKIDFIYTLLFHISLVTAVYVHIWVLIPVFLTKRRYLVYLGTVLALLFLSALINQLTFNKLTDIILPGYYFISYYEYDDILKFVFVYLVLSGLLKLSKGWFMLTEANRMMLELEKEKTQAELRALRSQVNPHFLFNSLNNIYSLAMKRSGKTAGIILKLSALMRYMLYESNEGEVPLKRELDYVKNYMELQKIRSENKASVSYVFRGRSGSLKIAPLLFLPFIENSFKHGVQGETGGGFVRMTIDIAEDSLDFFIENNKGSVDSIEVDNARGIGLDNARKRLELSYPEKHVLDIRDGEDRFSVRLVIKLGKEEPAMQDQLTRSKI